MGRDKALIELGGRPMVAVVAAALADAGLDVVTVGGPDRVAGLPNVSDSALGAGPMAGLLAALEFAAGRQLFLTAVDQPGLRPRTVQHLLAEPSGDAVVPLADGFPQVTCAVYRPAALPMLRDAVDARPGVAIRDALEGVDVTYVTPREWRRWGEDGGSWHSLNSPEDLAEFEQPADR